MTTPTSLGIGTRLGRYEIRSPLGAGGMAEVYLADDTELGRRVAVKILPPDTSTDEHSRKRLFREARAAAQLDHPHICAVYEIGEAAGHRFIAMQYVEGETLDQRLRRAPIALNDVLGIAADVADALSAAHAHGIIHRDIKPSNVIVTTRGQAVVLDFGLAKLGEAQTPASGDTQTESLLSAPGLVIGTLPYMSPEQVRGDALDGRSDIFSLGVLIYEMVAGQRPFSDTSTAAIASAILTRDPHPLVRFSAHVPAELERIVAKALRKDVEERYQTAKDLLIDLRTLRDELEFQRRLERTPSTGRVREPDAVAAEGSLEAPTPPAARAGSPRRTVIAVVAVIALAAVSWYGWRSYDRRRAAVDLVRVQALADAGRLFDAYDLAVTIGPRLSGDPVLTRLMSTIGMSMSVVTEPPGAQVYLKRFAPDAAGTLPPRQLAGTTPLKDLRVARGEYVLTIEKEGYAPLERTLSGETVRYGQLSVLPPPIRLERTLVAVGEIPERMAPVPGGDYRLVAWSRPTDARVKLTDFFIDRYEVTNQEYKEFIDAGGYLKREFWTNPFVRDGRTLSWDEAMRVFVDRTGLPGPRGWSGQKVPDGKADHPVTDVTWYEAAAYAAFRGKRLPTVFQWEKAARDGWKMAIASIMPWGAFQPGDTLAHHANFDNEGTERVSSGEFGMSPFGAYNMAGNVSEWTLSDTSQGRIATGGAWGDPTYVFARFALLPGFYSSNKLGFRCARDAPGATGDQGVMRIEIKEEIPDYTPSASLDFEKWRASYRYEKTPLEARVEEVVDTAAWRRETITFAGAAGDRATAYLYVPNHVPRPVQVIHLAPGGDVEGGMRSLRDSMEDRLAPLVKSGRAAFAVVLTGYIGRLHPAGWVPPEHSTVEFLESLADRITDLRRGLDYLESRQDIDASRIAYYGISAGAQIGLIAAAVETRYRSVALLGSGLAGRAYAGRIPDANPVNFAGHIRGPTLMIQGRYDEDTPLKTAAEPLFKLLPEPKRLVVFDGGHIAPDDYLVPMLTAWLDETLGRVPR